MELTLVYYALYSIFLFRKRIIFFFFFKGFHEAIGDTLALSVKTPKHFKEIGLLDADAPVDDYETSINFLFQMAMNSVANLPFTFLLDKYRWGIFDGSVGPSEYNAYWWKLRYILKIGLFLKLRLLTVDFCLYLGRAIKELNLLLSEMRSNLTLAPNSTYLQM